MGVFFPVCGVYHTKDKSGRGQIGGSIGGGSRTLNFCFVYFVIVNCCIVAIDDLWAVLYKSPLCCNVYSITEMREIAICKYIHLATYNFILNENYGFELRAYAAIMILLVLFFFLFSLSLCLSVSLSLG